MSENIYQSGKNIIIINGGDPLNGCPENWDQAYDIEKQLNEGKEENAEPIWDFDCGFKLDFDGPLLSVSSRFYPPKTHYGPTWDGTVTIFCMGEKVSEKKFDCPTLDELKKQVEEHIKSLAGSIMNFIAKY